MRNTNLKTLRNGASAAAIVFGLSAFAPAYAQSVDWSGGYMGIANGVSFASVDGHYGIVDDTGGWVEFEDNLLGSSAAVFAGYNWQNNNLVYGFEMDAAFSSLSGSASEQEPPGGSEDLTGGAEIDVTGFSSVRGRLGFATGNALVYGTAGVSFINASFHIFDSDESATRTNNAFAPVAGVGVEYAIGEKMVIGLEGLMHFAGGLEVSDFSDIGSTGYVDDSFNVSTPTTIRLRLSYRF